MITEDYVSYEIAELLREKGFDEACRCAYIWNTEEYELCPLFTKPIQFNGENDSEDYEDDSIQRISAPTLQMAMKYLRKVHNIFIQIELYSKHGDYCFEIFKNTHRLTVEKDEVYNTYEEAIEAAIKYCLENLI